MSNRRYTNAEQKERIRQRVRVQIDEDNYQFFPERKDPDYYDNDVNQRVGVYVRVSTDDPRQTTSYELQKRYYEDFVIRHPKWTLVGIYAEMLTPSMIQMHPAGVQTAPKMHTAPQTGCICRIFGVFSGCILEIKVHPPKIHVHIAQKKSCAGVRSQALKSKKKILRLHPNGG